MAVEAVDGNTDELDAPPFIRNWAAPLRYRCAMHGIGTLNERAGGPFALRSSAGKRGKNCARRRASCLEEILPLHHNGNDGWAD